MGEPLHGLGLNQGVEEACAVFNQPARLRKEFLGFRNLVYCGRRGRAYFSK